MDLASYIQTKKDMGCKASQVHTIEEGVNPQGLNIQEFWAILGGQTAYQGKIWASDNWSAGWLFPLGAAWHIYLSNDSGRSTRGGWAVWKCHCGNQLYLQTAGWQTGSWWWRMGKGPPQLSTEVRQGWWDFLWVCKRLVSSIDTIFLYLNWNDILSVVSALRRRLTWFSFALIKNKAVL